MEELRTPQAHHFIIPLAVSATLFVLAWSDTTPNGWTLALWALGAVGAFWSFMNCIHWATVVRGDYVSRLRELEFKFHPNFLVERIGKMTDYQVKAVRAGRGVIEVVPTLDGPVDYIRGTNVSLYAAWYILIRSTERTVYPINQFMTGTFHLDVMGDHAVDDYQQAKDFHTWLYQMGMGMWGRGNTSMTWTEGWNRERVMQQLGLAEDTYE